MSYASEVLADSPLGFWGLGASTPGTDLSPNGHNLSTVGTPTDTSSLVPTESDGAKDIDTPDTDYFELASGAGNADDFDFEGTAAFSVEAWINLDTTTADFERLVAHEDASNGWLLYYNNAAGIGIGRNRAASFALKDEVPGTFTGVVIHVVGTYDGSNLRLYFNGAEVGSPVADSTSIGAFTATFRIARSPLGGTTGMDGKIDAVSVYGSALSLSRIQAHYNAGIGLGSPILRPPSRRSAIAQKHRRM